MNPHHEQWLADRRSGIGGSDIGAILGLSPYRSAVDVYLDKIGHAPEVSANEAMFWGIVLEDVVAKHYQDATGRKVQRINEILRHPTQPFAIANIDRAIVAPGSRARFDGNKLLGADGILECKTASAYKTGEWGTCDDDDAIPTHYAAQAMWYLGITGLDWCDVPVLIGGQKYLIKRVERDDETIRSMLERAEAFWFRHVVARVAPEPKDGSDALTLFPRDSGRTIEANPKVLELLAKAATLKAQIAALELDLNGDRKKNVAGVAGEIKALMVDATSINIGDEVLATWKAQTAMRLDTTAFKAAHPDLYSQFTRPSESRVFRIK